MTEVSFTVDTDELLYVLLSHQLKTNSKLVLTRGRRYRINFWKDDYHCANWAGCPFKLSIRYYRSSPDVYHLEISQPHIHTTTLLPAKKRTLSELGKLVTAYMSASTSEIQKCMRDEVQKALEYPDLLTTMMLENFSETKITTEKVDIDAIILSKNLINKRKSYIQSLDRDLEGK